MLLKSIDYISPKLTLYYYGSRRHSSYLGGILTIIMVILSSSYVFYLIYNIIYHKFTNFMFYRTYIVDVEKFIFNDTTGIYHYFQLYDFNKKAFGAYNSKYIRIFMSRLYRNYQKNPEVLYEDEHWVYDNCRQGLDNKNIDNQLFNMVDNFTDGACLRYYYNNEKHKYFPIEDEENFKYPYLIHGTGNKNNLFLGTVIEKCKNSSITSEILGSCGPVKEIEEYFEEYKGINLQLLSKRVDTDNYTKPIYQFFYSICETLDFYTIPVNNLNIMPFFIEIKSGFFLPNGKKISTYSLDFNRRENLEIPQNEKIMAIFDFWLQNSAQIIRGGYSTIYDILPSIGGIIQLIYYIFYSFNFLYNKYIVIKDCNRAFFRMYNTEDSQDALNKYNFSECVKSFRDESKFKYGRTSKILNAIREKRDSIYIAKFKQSLKSVTGYNNNISKKLDENNKNNLSNSNDIIVHLQNNNIYNSSQNINGLRNKKFFKQKREELINFEDNNFSKELKEFINKKNNLFKVEPLNVKITSKFINFFYFMLFLFKFKRKSKIFFILNAFRQKLLSEEHIFRTNVILYHLEKYFNIKEIQKIDILELYENL